ncbi:MULTISPECIES: alpha-glucan family phosphorylase [unclassified Pseudonocardia]|uniref:alpha-glucan family phosphorylase n=1 Tax=unclassified Pseudonocardia TaxID=2619320 RepID=UPI0009592090|nr:MULTISPECIES: alpha-glucan family phosphorylase [unclassified Pseudonocardia]MBN9097425.1 alpha-glucan family phosphorylase [Pseudonocardia sp.]OJY45905.1 MAG: glycogen phosphorylase [Pseudonocardia sp. 73-21]
MRALRRFTVRAQLPPALAPLQTLATNLRWSWHAPTHDMFATLDPDAWERAGQDPVRLLGEISTGRFEELAADAETVVTVRELADDLESYLSRPRWYQSEREDDPTLPAAVGYFSMEFGVSEVLPNYSGGLGVLAGDHLKSASDLGVPLIGVGLLYRSGYFRQSLSLDGWQLEHYPALDPQGLPLQLLTRPDSGSAGAAPGADGEPVLVEIAMPGDRVLKVRVWQAAVGRVPLLLLDSDIEENEPDLRGVTDRLYGGDQDQRIRQEILVGIGGVRAVRAFCRVTGHPEPEVFHTNEGHAGYLGLERIRELAHTPGLSFDEAVATVRAGTVFTTHTPVPAGIDRFPVDMVKHYFGEHLLPGVPTDRVLALGAENNPTMFNMAHMGLRLAQRANGVSQLHGAVSRGMFGSLWEGFDADEVPIGSVTNGVHGSTWEAREVTELIGEPGHFAASVGDEELWHLRGALRARLVTEVRRRVREAWLQRGASLPELSWTEHVFDPNVLTVGFARRVPTYKRLTLMLRDKDRLRDLLLDPHRPVQLVVAGKSHPADDGGKALIQEIVQFADDPAVRHRIVFLPDYDMSMARYLYWGCDVWLNNPLRPLEACGTSGMKSALNGGLNLSIRDGWWDEFYDGSNGWAIPTADGIEDPTRRDDLEANALYELLATQVGPAFYERDAQDVPTRWVELVRHTLTTLRPQIQATRMVREYAEGLYAPAARAAAAVVADGYAGAKEVAAYRARLGAAWPKVEVLGVDASGLPDTPVVGAPMTVRALVQLSGLDPSDVVVQAVVGQVDEDEELHGSRTVAMQYVEPAEGGGERFEAVVPLPYAGLTGYTVRVLPHHPLLASAAELGKVVLAG